MHSFDKKSPEVNSTNIQKNTKHGKADFFWTMFKKFRYLNSYSYEIVYFGKYVVNLSMKRINFGKIVLIVGAITF